MSEWSGKDLPSVTSAPAPDQAVLADLGAVEEDRAHADQAVVADEATVQDHIVADHAVRADDERKTRIGVKSRVVLNL